MIYLTFILLGLLVGFGSSLLGLGGSIFIIPALPLVVDIPFRELIATSIFCVCLVTFINTVKFHKNNLIDWKLAFKILPISSLFSFIGAELSQYINEKMIIYVMIFVILVMIIRLLFFVNMELRISYTLKNLIIFISASIAGILSGLTGIGAGVLLGPTIMALNLTDHKKISPVINFLIFISCFFASISYLEFKNQNFPLMGFVRVDYAFYIFILSQIGSYFGRRYNSLITHEARKKLISIVLVLFVVKLILT